MENVTSKEWYTFKKELADNIDELINKEDETLDKETLRVMALMLKNTRIKRYT